MKRKLNDPKPWVACCAALFWIEKIGWQPRVRLMPELGATIPELSLYRGWTQAGGKKGKFRDWTIEQAAVLPCFFKKFVECCKLIAASVLNRSKLCMLNLPSAFSANPLKRTPLTFAIDHISFKPRNAVYYVLL